MSLDTYRSLDKAGDPFARQYLQQNFEALFGEAIDEFAFYGRLAVGIALLAVITAFAVWIGLRKRLPLRWAWLVPLIALTGYASLKSSVVLELIRLAPDLPQMWTLYFKSWTPLRMVRTSVSGLVVLSALMWGAVVWNNHAGRRPSPWKSLLLPHPQNF